MKKHLLSAVIYTVVTAVLLGIVYPLVVTAAAHVLFPSQASGQLVQRDGVVVGSHLIGQTFSGAGYFHGRPSAAGTGYDASASSGSNLAPTNKALIDRVQAGVTTEQGIGNVPIDLVTTSGSGLDPDISPAAALYQAPRVSTERHLPAETVATLVRQHTVARQFGLLGEPRVNVLELNLALDDLSKR